MHRERALKIVLVVVGLLFCAAIYPLILMAKQDPALARMMSLYATLGVFLLLAARDPSANRRLIAFTALSSFAHAALMAVQAFRNLIARGELIGSVVLVVIGIASHRAGSGEASSRTRIGSSSLGLHSGKTPTPRDSHPQARPST